MKVLVVYDSIFGNTEMVAGNIKTAFEKNGDDVLISQVKGAHKHILQDIDLIVIGSPTRAFKPTKDIVNFIKSLDKDISGKTKFAVFDTRMDVKNIDNKLLTVMVNGFGYANDTMIKLIKKQGGQLIGESRGFIVEESEGPLRESEYMNTKTYVAGICK